MGYNDIDGLERCLSTCVVILWLIGGFVIIIYGYVNDVALNDVAVAESVWSIFCFILFALVQILVKPLMDRAYRKGKTSSVVEY